MNRAFIFCFVIALAGPLIAGCDGLNNIAPEASGPGANAQVAPDLAMAFLWDPTITAAENRAAADLFLRRVIRSQSIPNGTHVAIIRFDADPKVLYDGVKSNTAKILQAWGEASNSKLTGTDQVRAFDQALGWFNAPEQVNAKRKVLVGWTDLKPDPWKDGSRLVRSVDDPRRYGWGNARAINLEVIIAGVPYNTQTGFRKAWEPRFVIQPRLFGPRHDLSLSDLGFQADDSIL